MLDVHGVYKDILQFELMISIVSYEKKKSINKALLLKKQTKCARLKAMASEIVSFFSSNGLQFKVRQRGDEKPGRSQPLLR